MLKKGIFLVLLMFLCNCSTKYYICNYDRIPKEFATKERIDKAKSYAEYFFNKCDTKDYSEIQDFELDINTKRYLSPEGIEARCKKINEKYGKITVGELYKMKAASFPKNFRDYFVFKAKMEKTDSLKYVVVQSYRDKNLVVERLFITSNLFPKKIKK